MNSRALLAVLGLALALPSLSAQTPPPAKPNILYILCDDLGWGDVRAYNPQGKIATPAMDQLAADGMRFTDAHSSSGVCTPTRYGLLTGRYAWRTHLQHGVLGGLSQPLIAEGRTTVASLLKAQGYKTACIGKWHLGMQMPMPPLPKPADGNYIEKGPESFTVDYSQPILRGPTTVGFDYYFGISGSLDMVPYIFIENDRFVGRATEEQSYPMMLGGEKKTRAGAGAPEFDAAQVLPRLTQKAIEYVEQQKAGEPFFLYLPLASPHTPILPTEDWRGRSGLNAYGDFVQQTDSAIGAVLAALARKGLAENTLVVLTSDNGCSPQADYPALLERGHHPSGPWRGTKADAFEGGHRVPFIVRWPGRVKAGSTSEATLCHTDLLATVAQMTGAALPAGAGEDSVSFLPVLRGETTPGRIGTVLHSANGTFAIRQGPWKLILSGSSGGWSEPRPGTPAAKKALPEQLYNLHTDPGETNNLAATEPGRVTAMTELLEKYVAEGRSTPGEPQQNDAPIEIWRDRISRAKSR